MLLLWTFINFQSFVKLSCELEKLYQLKSFKRYKVLDVLYIRMVIILISYLFPWLRKVCKYKIYGEFTFLSKYIKTKCMKCTKTFHRNGTMLSRSLKALFKLEYVYKFEQKTNSSFKKRCLFLAMIFFAVNDGYWCYYKYSPQSQEISQ